MIDLHDIYVRAVRHDPFSHEEIVKLVELADAVATIEDLQRDIRSLAKQLDLYKGEWRDDAVEDLRGDIDRLSEQIATLRILTGRRAA